MCVCGFCGLFMCVCGGFLLLIFVCVCGFFNFWWGFVLGECVCVCVDLFIFGGVLF